MATQRYSVTPHPIQTLLTWVDSNEIAIPEIQRPFVWDATKVRNLLDSLYQYLRGAQVEQPIHLIVKCYAGLIIELKVIDKLADQIDVVTDIKSKI